MFVEPAAMSSGTVMIVTGDQSLENMVRGLLAQKQVRVVGASQWQDLAKVSSAHKVNLIIYDMAVREVDFLSLKAAVAGIPVVVICEQLSPDVRARAAAIKIFELMEKPVVPSELSLVITRELRAGKARDRGQANGINVFESVTQLVTRSRRMSELREQIEKLAQMPDPLLVTGETGVGKGEVARAIHLMDPKNKMPMVICNCAKLDKRLINSELFGHEKDTFAGAETRHIGLVERAGTGTITIGQETYQSCAMSCWPA